MNQEKGKGKGGKARPKTLPKPPTPGLVHRNSPMVSRNQREHAETEFAEMVRQMNEDKGKGKGGKVRLLKGGSKNQSAYDEIFYQVHREEVAFHASRMAGTAHLHRPVEKFPKRPNIDKPAPAIVDQQPQMWRAQDHHAVDLAHNRENAERLHREFDEAYVYYLNTYASLPSSPH